VQEKGFEKEKQEADEYIKKVGESATEGYIKLRDIEAQMKLYEKVGPGDKVIVTDGSPVIPLINTSKGVVQ
jgi:hypothetical protein